MKLPRCVYCNKAFRPKRRKQIYCCAAHRTAAYRKRRYEETLETRMDALVATTNLGLLRQRMKTA